MAIFFSGNIVSLFRRDQTGSIMHNIRYSELTISNRLQSITATGLNNSTYQYDKIGNLTNDAAENLTVQWNAAGKVKSFYKGAQEYRLSYSPMGQRQIKGQIQNGAIGLYDVYIHDAQGNVMAVYSTNLQNDELKLTERHIYGSARLGVYNNLFMHHRQQASYLPADRKPTSFPIISAM